MRVVLTPHMKILLKEVVANALAVANEAHDVELIESLDRITKVIGQANYRDFKEDDLQALWHFADTGSRTCDMLKEKADPFQFEKTVELQAVYDEIKFQIEEAFDSERKSRGIKPIVCPVIPIKSEE